MVERKVVCVDLDGTIAHYIGWQGDDHFGEPIEGVRNALEELKASGWTIIIYTTRASRDKIARYLEAHEIPFDDINNNDQQPGDAEGGKLYADVYVDDRAVRFNGDWGATVDEVKRFKPWEERS